jgi:hypothetical protein
MQFVRMSDAELLALLRTMAQVRFSPSASAPCPCDMARRTPLTPPYSHRCVHAAHITTLTPWLAWHGTQVEATTREDDAPPWADEPHAAAAEPRTAGTTSASRLVAFLTSTAASASCAFPHTCAVLAAYGKASDKFVKASCKVLTGGDGASGERSRGWDQELRDGWVFAANSVMRKHSVWRFCSLEAVASYTWWVSIAAGCRDQMARVFAKAVDDIHREVLAAASEEFDRWRGGDPYHPSLSREGDLLGDVGARLGLLAAFVELPPEEWLPIVSTSVREEMRLADAVRACRDGLYSHLYTSSQEPPSFQLSCELLCSWAKTIPVLAHGYEHHQNRSGTQLPSLQ